MTCRRCAPFGICFCGRLSEMHDAPPPEPDPDDEEEIYVPPARAAS